MATPLDMSLDDLISKNKRSAAAAAARASSFSSASRGSGGPAPSRRLANRPARRAAPYSAHKVPGGYAAQMEGVVYQPAIETGAKLYVSNLDYGVSNEDIKELFSEVGELKRFSIHYDRSGRSKGTAEVVFARRPDALAAVKRYNNVQLDGKPMKIEIVGTNLSTPPVPMVPNGRNGNLNGFPRSGPTRGPTRGGSTGGPRGGRAGGRGRGRGGQGRGRGEPPSATDLDADLEKYHKGAMQIN